MIEWGDEFATGSESIDGQHKMLILYVNQLETILKATRPTTKEVQFATSLVDFLQQYAKTHFGFEEQCMECYRCTAHNQNKLQHAQFLDFFDRFHERFKTEGFSVEAFRDLHQMTSAWVVSHILRIDTQLKPLIKH